MTKQGKVLRVPGDRPGLLIVEGQQFQFALNDLWKSRVIPTPGLMVEVNLDAHSQLIAAAPADPLQYGRKQRTGAKAIRIIAKFIERLGVMNLVAALALIVAWRLLTNVSLQTPLVGKLDFTFWQVLGLVNKGNVVRAIDIGKGSYSVGYYGWLAAMALAAPFLNRVWKDKLAAIGGLFPFLFTIIIWMLARSMVQNAFAASLGDSYASSANPARLGAMHYVSLGLGAYVSMLAGLYFALIATKRYFSLQVAGADHSSEQSSRRIAPLS